LLLLALQLLMDYFEVLALDSWLIDFAVVQHLM
jgi:hypothetical protein